MNSRQISLKVTNFLVFISVDLVKITPLLILLLIVLSKGNTPAIIFLKIKKAFDTVDHKVLIEQLKFYLSDSKQATKFLGEKVSFFVLSLVFLRVACLDNYCLVFILMILLMNVTCLIFTYLLMVGHFYLEISAGKLT